MPKPSSPTISNKPSDPVAAQDQQETSSQETWWEAVEILDQKGDRYLISWAGVDKNGNPYEPTWVDNPRMLELMGGTKEKLFASASERLEKEAA